LSTLGKEKASSIEANENVSSNWKLNSKGKVFYAVGLANQDEQTVEWAERVYTDEEKKTASDAAMKLLVDGDAKPCGDTCADTAAPAEAQTCAVWKLDGEEWFTGCAPEAKCNTPSTSDV